MVPQLEELSAFELANKKMMVPGIKKCPPKFIPHDTLSLLQSITSRHCATVNVAHDKVKKEFTAWFSNHVDKLFLDKALELLSLEEVMTVQDYID